MQYFWDYCRNVPWTSSLPMSTGGPNTQRFSPFTPPLRGSFPLDREHKCDAIVREYLSCIKAYNQAPKGKLSKERVVTSRIREYE